MSPFAPDWLLSSSEAFVEVQGEVAPIPRLAGRKTRQIGNPTEKPGNPSAYRSFQVQKHGIDRVLRIIHTYVAILKRPVERTK
ncbi:MAG: hypothetical protein KatS3mg105_1718 [Gemmatales bacterium]|nr:MAG: hypothetical protein KatS3mg105_1718 [Gemmatales bacterium]